MAAGMKFRTVWCTFRVVMFHEWPDAPAHQDYLRARHRHEFHFKAWFGVRHADRDKEFCTLKDKCMALVATAIHEKDTGTWSCEQWADFIIESMPDCVEVEVSEDGENGATVIDRRRIQEFSRPEGDEP